MKFVALALVLLLAVGSQAAPMQNDAVSQLDQIREGVKVYLDSLKQKFIKSLDELDGTEYAGHKPEIIRHVEEGHKSFLDAQGRASQYTDVVIVQAEAATAEHRAKVKADFEQLKKNLSSQYAELEDVVKKHFNEYKPKLVPIIAHVEETKAKLDSVVTELKPIVERNVEETKSKLMPMVETVRTKATEYLEELKTMLAPHVQEYREQFQKAYEDAEGKVKSLDAVKVQEMRDKISPLGEEIKTKLSEIYTIIDETVNKS